METHEYAFDCKLIAVVRVRAVDEAAARSAMENVIDAINPCEQFIEGYNSVAKPAVEITEVSLALDDAGAPYGQLFEVDGEEPK